MKLYAHNKKAYLAFVLLIAGSFFTAALEASSDVSIPADRVKEIQPTGVPVQHSIETSDHKTFLIDSKNMGQQLSDKVLMLFSYQPGDMTGPSYMRVNTKDADMEHFSRLHPGSSGSYFTSNLVGDVIVDFKFDNSDPDKTFLELLYSDFHKDSGDSFNDFSKRWNVFYNFLDTQFGNHPAENNAPAIAHSNSDDSQDQSSKTTLKTNTIKLITSYMDFGKFTAKEITFKPPQINVRVKTSADAQKNNDNLKILNAYIKNSLNQPGFIKVSRSEKSENASQALLSDSENLINALKALFGLDVLELKKYLEEFQKLTENITQEELVNLRPFYEALVSLLKSDAGIDAPAAPAFGNKVSPEELEWRKQMDRLAYEVLMGEGSLGPDKMKTVSFRSKYRQIFKTYVLPVKERYNKRVSTGLEEFLKQLKDMLANKTTQVIVKSTKQNTEFVIDINATKAKE